MVWDAYAGLGHGLGGLKCNVQSGAHFDRQGAAASTAPCHRHNGSRAQAVSDSCHKLGSAWRKAQPSLRMSYRCWWSGCTASSRHMPIFTSVCVTLTTSWSPGCEELKAGGSGRVGGGHGTQGRKPGSAAATWLVSYAAGAATINWSLPAHLHGGVDADHGLQSQSVHQHAAQPHLQVKGRQEVAVG